MSEFEKWYKEKYPQALKQNTTDSDKYALEIWQAASSESDKRIAELKTIIAQQDEDDFNWRKQVLELKAENKQIDAINARLQANINVLREALERALEDLVPHHTKASTYKSVNEALASTPAQSLIQHDNEVIERVVTLLKDSAWNDGIIDMRVDDLIEDVRKLKEDEFPHSANLDIYNSVRFTDAPYGTMIMESKIVKWLCRNRAKDYFDEMVEGKL